MKNITSPEAGPREPGEGADWQPSPSTPSRTIATPSGSRIVQWVMGTHKHRTLVRSPRLLLFNPAVAGKSFVYVRSDARRSRLMVRGRRRHGSGRILFTLKRSGGELFSDALTDSVAFLTILEPSASNADATIVRVSRRHPRRLQERAPRGGGNHRY